MSDPIPPAEQPEPDRRRKIDVRIDDDRREGTYANLLVVSHGPHEFTLDFCQVGPQVQQTGEAVRADVVTRVRIAPTMVAQMLQALNTNLNGYEERFGAVRAVG